MFVSMENFKILGRLSVLGMRVSGLCHLFWQKIFGHRMELNQRLSLGFSHPERRKKEKKAERKIKQWVIENLLDDKANLLCPEYCIGQ